MMKSALKKFFMLKGALFAKFTISPSKQTTTFLSALLMLLSF